MKLTRKDYMRLAVLDIVVYSFAVKICEALEEKRNGEDWYEYEYNIDDIDYESIERDYIEQVNDILISMHPDMDIHDLISQYRSLLSEGMDLSAKDYPTVDRVAGMAIMLLLKTVFDKLAEKSDE